MSAISRLVFVPVVLFGLGPAAVSAVTAAADTQGANSKGECERYRGDSYELLFRARTFSSSHIGLNDDSTPHEVRALRCITQEVDALNRVRRIAETGSLAGQLYALVALRYLDAHDFKALLADYANSKVRVEISGGGDVVTYQEAGQIAHWIDQDLYWIFLPALNASKLKREPEFSVLPN